MALTEKQVTSGIKFGNWMLVPLDDRNWELCHWHVAKATGRNAGGTVPQWNRLGRYYSYNTFDLAVQYAADVELKERHREVARDIIEAMKEWRGTLDAFRADVGKLLAPDDA